MPKAMQSRHQRKRSDMTRTQRLQAEAFKELVGTMMTRKSENEPRLATAELGALDRAVQMLCIAAEFIDEHATEATIQYDGTICDGSCVASDCESAAAELSNQFIVLRTLFAAAPANRDEER